ncbi:iron-containing alcohol dehydrogenase [Micromonospora sp. M12]
MQADYEVVCADNILDPASEELVNRGRQPGNHVQRRFVVLDRAVDAIYGNSIRAYFEHHRVECRYLVMPGGEQCKVMDSVMTVVAALDRFGVDRRREPVISIGGGVLLDLVGVATALYRRGIPHVRVPTTLISLVDAAIGAKTGVNHGAHKNRLGTYQTPTAVLLDRRFLLPRRAASPQRPGRGRQAGHRPRRAAVRTARRGR